MKHTAVAILLGLFVAGGAVAGSMAADEKTPHHGMQGGCSSKAKIAKFKELYGDDWAKQAPSDKVREEAKANKAKFTNLGRFI